MARLIAILLLILFIPLGILVSVIILINDGFPIFFIQRRIGKNNIIFKLYKFRTMLNGTPDIATDELESPDNYYIKSGALIRRLSLDELPQLFNIILGDMSFIGPRPALYNQAELIRKRNFMDLHKLMPGITGWAQINGRDFLSIDEKVALDEYYMLNKSYHLDFKILILSIFKVIKMDNVK